MAVEIKEFSGGGYMPLFSSDGWRVAVANSCERLLEKNLCRLERHLKTDEVFILLYGKAVLYIGKDLVKYPMEIGKIYNVKCGEWHCISMKPNSKVAIIENDDTAENNTEYYFFKEV